VSPPLAVVFNILRRLERFRGNVGEGSSIVVSSVGAIVRIATVHIKVPGTGVGLAQHPDSEIVVHALAAPAGGGGVGVDVNAELGVGVCQGLPVVGVGSGAANDLEVPSVRVQEAPAAAVLGFDRDLALVN
jgi:hypothetical protein